MKVWATLTIRDTVGAPLWSEQIVYESKEIPNTPSIMWVIAIPEMPGRLTATVEFITAQTTRGATDAPGATDKRSN